MQAVLGSRVFAGPLEVGACNRAGWGYAEKAGDFILPWGLLSMMGSFTMYYCQFNVSLMFEY